MPGGKINAIAFKKHGDPLAGFSQMGFVENGQILRFSFLISIPLPCKKEKVMNEESLRSLQTKLDEFHQWPCRFMFKFIVPEKKTGELSSFFAGRPFTTRSSKNGKYVSFTAELEMRSSGEVIALYREAGKIEGIIAL